ncbi:potassium/sodium hyperpolarization-activated cyclic nucleotide-gated channel 3-like [Myxocyprinus asiaticus]|uniref:potassium/sodium hyperpolarization-activated cyclic nucleotide-gated channel 3-like n=1 Tax=Myxocyprinus asiaticus TaxID=70543 RepID=UPI0022214222|nr:potassium/sodium hyperpolarization-activated cyclic nucleotide-gated channel 3-like [Myxocyprinus asiaticus]
MPALVPTTLPLLITFLDTLHGILIPAEQRGGPEQPWYIVIWDNAMEDECGEVDVGAFGGWIRHSRRFFPHCLARENITCDVDEVHSADIYQERPKDHKQKHRHYYLMFMVVLTFVNLITIPLDLAFSDDMHGVAHKCWVAFNVFSDIIFAFDVGLNFRIGILDGQVPILDLKHIRKDYLSTWFFPDLVAAFPMDIIIIILEQHYHADTSSLMASKMLRALMFVRVLGMIRLLRVPRLLRFCSQLESVIRLEKWKKILSFRYVFVILMMFLIWHWNGCIQYFISALAEFPPDSWVMKENLLNTSVGVKYSFGLCRALSQMTLMSTDPPTPICMEEWWTIIITRLIGFFILIAILAFMNVTVGNAYKKKKKPLKSSKIFSMLPRALRRRITQHYQWQFENNILDTVSKPLKKVLKLVSQKLQTSASKDLIFSLIICFLFSKDIMATICYNLLTKGLMLKNRDTDFIEAILMKLKCEFFQPGDIIIRKNAKADRMYFIEYGRVLLKTQCLQRELCDGDHFGGDVWHTFCSMIQLLVINHLNHYSTVNHLFAFAVHIATRWSELVKADTVLLLGGDQLATVHAVTGCRLFSLSVAKLKEVEEEFPEVFNDLRAAAQQRKNNLQYNGLFT